MQHTDRQAVPRRVLGWGAHVGSDYVKLMEGRSWWPDENGHEFQGHAEAFLVIDPTARSTWTVVGAEFVSENGELTKRQGVQDSDRKELTFQACNRGAKKWCYLHFAKTLPSDQNVHIEILKANDTDGPCQSLYLKGRRSLPSILVALFCTYSRDGQVLYTIIGSALSPGDVPPGPSESILVRNGVKLTAGVSLGVVAAIAAPFAVMGVVSALGFSSGGIVAGSTAAGMMSAEAAASGGAIAAGGTVATLQSIGAAGLGVAGTTGSAAVGAVGGTLLGSAGGAVAQKIEQKMSHSITPVAAETTIADGKWYVIAEEWFGKGCEVYVLVGQEAAYRFFEGKCWCTRILVNPFGQEVAKGIFVSDKFNHALARIRGHWQAYMKNPQ